MFQLLIIENEELLFIFDASFDGDTFNLETFDKKFFLDNAHDLIEEMDKIEEEKNKSN